MRFLVVFFRISCRIQGESALKQTTHSLPEAWLPHSSPSLRLAGRNVNISLWVNLRILSQGHCLFLVKSRVLSACSTMCRQKHDLMCVNSLSGRRHFADQRAWLSGRRRTRRFVRRCQSTPNARVRELFKCWAFLLGKQKCTDWTLINNTYSNRVSFTL
jgi:hypothetical protein